MTCTAAHRRPLGVGLVVSANAGAAAMWFVVNVMLGLFELREELGAFTLLAGLPMYLCMLAALGVAVVATAVALPLVVTWARAERPRVLPGLSLAHLLVAWGYALVVAAAH